MTATSGPGRVLAVDLGTTGLKVAVFDERGILLAGAAEPVTTHHGAAGAAEQDPDDWWAALGRCARRAVAAADAAATVSLVAVTSQYSTSVAVASDGRPLAPAVLWMDQRPAAFQPLRRPGADDPLVSLVRWIEIHGIPPGGADVLAQWAMLRATAAEVWASAAAIVQPVDQVLARLTSVVAANPNTAFPLMLTDNRAWATCSYSDELLERSGFDADTRLLPELRPFGEPRGPLTAAAAEHLGLRTRPSAMGGTIDTVSGAVGTGAIGGDALGVLIGTTSVTVAHVDAMAHDLEHGITTAPSPVPGRYVVIAENGIGGRALEWFVRTIMRADDDGDSAPSAAAFDLAESIAASAPPGAGGVAFAPWLVGSMAPEFDPHQRGAFIGMHLGSTRGHLARAVFEGVAANLARLVPHVAALGSVAPDTPLVFGGGGAASGLWGQLLADVLDRPVHRVASPRLVNARGAALIALAEAGHIGWSDLAATLEIEQHHEPDPAATVVQRRLVDALDELQSGLVPILSKIRGDDR